MVIADIRNPIPKDNELKELIEKKRELDKAFQEGGLIEKAKIGLKLLDINHEISKASIKPLN